MVIFGLLAVPFPPASKSMVLLVVWFSVNSHFVVHHCLMVIVPFQGVLPSQIHSCLINFSKALLSQISVVSSCLKQKLSGFHSMLMELQFQFARTDVFIQLVQDSSQMASTRICHLSSSSWFGSILMV